MKGWLRSGPARRGGVWWHGDPAALWMNGLVRQAVQTCAPRAALLCRLRMVAHWCNASAHNTLCPNRGWLGFEQNEEHDMEQELSRKGAEPQLACRLQVPSPLGGLLAGRSCMPLKSLDCSIARFFCPFRIKCSTS